MELHKSLIICLFSIFLVPALAADKPEKFVAFSTFKDSHNAYLDSLKTLSDPEQLPDLLGDMKLLNQTCVNAAIMLKQKAKQSFNPVKKHQLMKYYRRYSSQCDHYYPGCFLGSFFAKVLNKRCKDAQNWEQCGAFWNYLEQSLPQKYSIFKSCVFDELERQPRN